MSAMSNSIAALFLKIMGRGMKGVYKLDPEMRAMAKSFSDGYTVRLRVLGSSAKLIFGIKDSGIVIYKHNNAPIVADLEIVFKSIELLMPILKGNKSIKTAFSEHDFTLKGDVAEAMDIVCLINFTIGYLYPNRILNKIFAKLPHRAKPKSRLIAYLLLGI